MVPTLEPMVDPLSNFHHITPEHSEDGNLASVLQNSTSTNLQHSLQQQESTSSLGQQQLPEDPTTTPYRFLLPPTTPVHSSLSSYSTSSSISNLKEPHFQYHQLQQQQQQPQQQQQQQQQFPSHIKDFYNLFHQSAMQQSSLHPYHRFSQMNMGAPGISGHHDFSPFCDSYYDTEGGKIPLTYARVWLDHQSLWRRFSVSGNEMIITKMGRRMFPVLSFGIHSLNFNDFYSMEVEIVQSDNNRYKYVSVTGWRINGVASQHEGNKRMCHPDGVQTGEYWQRNGIAFKRIKLTNKKTAKEGSNHIVLNSMHKYHIQLVIKQLGMDDQVIATRKFEFNETEFIAVTAYQNDDVTQLKIDHNPFAKAFRDNGGDHCDRRQMFEIFGGLSSKRRKYNNFDNTLSTTVPSSSAYANNHIQQQYISSHLFKPDSSPSQQYNNNFSTMSLPTSNLPAEQICHYEESRNIFPTLSKYHTVASPPVTTTPFVYGGYNTSNIPSLYNFNTSTWLQSMNANVNNTPEESIREINNNNECNTKIDASSFIGGNGIKDQKNEDSIIKGIILTNSDKDDMGIQDMTTCSKQIKISPPENETSFGTKKTMEILINKMKSELNNDEDP